MVWLTSAGCQPRRPSQHCCPGRDRAGELVSFCTAVALLAGRWGCIPGVPEDAPTIEDDITTSTMLSVLAGQGQEKEAIQETISLGIEVAFTTSEQEQSPHEGRSQPKPECR